jgi:hypothetical protein
MGLRPPGTITVEQTRRTAITIIRRNWHLLPYEQLLELLGWSADELAYTLQEDDFLWVKLGRLKPACAPIRWDPAAVSDPRTEQVRATVRQEFDRAPGRIQGKLLGFIPELSRPARRRTSSEPAATRFGDAPRFCSSYFSLFGDPLLNPDAAGFPAGYLAKLADAGVNGVWLHSVLYKLARFPWQPELSERMEERLANLRQLIERTAAFGIGVYLYLNEPRSMPLPFFDRYPDLRGAVEGDYAALCTSHRAVQEYLREAIASVCRSVPGLTAFFSITASENFTNCWSYHRGNACPRCGPRGAAEVIVEVNRVFQEGILRGGTGTKLISWDWGWRDQDAEAIIKGLPADMTQMSVSEWDLPICRGGVQTTVGEYSLSAIGPGPRARRHWAWAREAGRGCLAKIQAANTWELSAIPYVPALENTARHIANLREEGVGGLMLGWSLGGYPSPNLEVVAEMLAATESGDAPAVEGALQRVANRRYGKLLGPLVVEAWRTISAAFQEFPYHIGTVYNAPLQCGPANLLWPLPTQYRATMVGLAYDDLERWRSVYPPEVFADQLEHVANGFDRAVDRLESRVAEIPEESVSRGPRRALARELGLATSAALHFRSVARQTRFIVARDQLAHSLPAEERAAILERIRGLLHAEICSARTLYALQLADSRIGFEATNQYFYVPLDLVEKVLNCRALLNRYSEVDQAEP